MSRGESAGRPRPLAAARPTTTPGDRRSVARSTTRRHPVPARSVAAKARRHPVPGRPVAAKARRHPVPGRPVAAKARRHPVPGRPVAAKARRHPVLLENVVDISRQHPVFWEVSPTNRADTRCYRECCRHIAPTPGVLVDVADRIAPTLDVLPRCRRQMRPHRPSSVASATDSTRLRDGGTTLAAVSKCQ